jgi:hypothetical protein
MVMRGFLVVTPLLALAACGSPKPAEEAAPEAPVSVEPAPLDPDAAAAEQAALANCGPVTTQGYCGVTFGMTPDAAKTKFPVKLQNYSGDTSAQPDPNACFELFPAEPVQGVTFLVEMAKVGRVDVMSEAPKTSDGFGVGSSADDIKAKFGAGVTEMPNKYEAEVKELSVMDGPAKFIFEIQDGKVRAWRAGILPTIDYVEHCG